MKTLNFNFAKHIVAATLALMLMLPMVAEAFVTTSGMPLSATNMVPGNYASGSFSVENIIGTTQEVYVFAATTTSDFALFEDWMTFEIGGDGALSGDLGDLLNPQLLSEIPAGETDDFTFKLTLKNDAPQNPLMGKSFSFDLVVVLEGGATEVVPVVYSGSGGSRSARTTPAPSVLGASTDVCEEYLTGYIHPNKQNDAGQVTRLQTFLRDLEGHHNLEVTGVYDSATQKAVSEFQQKYADRVLRPWGLPMPTSFVYYTTKKMVNEIYCQFTVEFPLNGDQEKEIAWYRTQGTSYNFVSGSSSSAVDKISETVSSTVEQAQETASSIGEQAATALKAGSGFWKSVSNFFKGFWPW